MKKFLQEFKTFATKGNVFDLAVGIIIGGAFGKIVTSFVNDLFMPLISMIIGNTNLADMRIILKAAEGETAELAIRYGLFIQTTIDFLLIAFVVFFMVKILNKLKKKEEETPAPAPTKAADILLLEEIRDLLKNK